MKIRYPKRRLKYNLIFGSLFSIFGITAFIIDPDNFVNFGYLIIGLLYLGLYLFENSKQYLTIENGIITKHNLRPKSLELDEIIHIKNFAGDYVLKTKQDELTINKSFVEKNSLFELEKVLEGLNLNAKETSNVPWNLP